MVIFSRIKFRERSDFGNNGFIVCAAFIQFVFIVFSFLFLFIVAIEDSAAVLCSYIGALAVQACGIMHFKENLKQFIIAYFVRLINNLHTLRMAGFS